MLDKVRNTVKRFGMLNSGDTVVIGVSGGVDSVVLLHILASLSEEYKLSIIAAHLNHGLRGKESDRDEAFVKKLANKLGIKFTHKRVDINALLKKGDSLQDIAREVRYAFFEDVAKRSKADRIATGHNLDDQAETMIIRFLRGAGLNGLSGILPKRGKYIRPLLDVSRKEIEEYADNNRLRFVRDSSNKSTKYLRNHIRLKLMPALEHYNPRLKNDMARLAHIIAKDEEYLEDKAKDAYKKCVKDQDKSTVVFYLKKLTGLHDAIKARIFFMVVEKLLGSSKGFYSYHVQDFLKLLNDNAPNISINLPHNLTLYKEYDVVTIERSQKTKVSPRVLLVGRQRRCLRKVDISFEQALKINGKTAVIADSGFRITEFRTELLTTFNFQPPTPSNVAYFDYDKLKMPLIVRNFRPGDRMAPFGMRGHKKVKEFFQEKKITRRRRGLIPIVVSGDEIIWVAGIRQAEHGKIGFTTRKILKLAMV